MPATRRTAKLNTENPNDKLNDGIIVKQGSAASTTTTNTTTSTSTSSSTKTSTTTPSENKTREHHDGDDDDLNYDEYDLAEECDISIKCKVCQNLFNSLEKFISHKNTNCKRRSKPGTPKKLEKSSATPSAATSSNTKKSSEISPNKTSNKRKAESIESTTQLLEDGNESEDRSSPLGFAKDKTKWKVYGGKKRRITKVQPPSDILTDEVIFIDTSDPAPEELQIKYESDDEDEEDASDDGGYDDVVTLSYKEMTKEEEEIEVPVKLSSAPVMERKNVVQTEQKDSTRKEAAAAAVEQQSPSLIYALVKVDEIEAVPDPCPSLLLTVDQLKKVKYMNLMQPFPPVLGSFIENDTAKPKPKYLPHELETPTEPPSPTDALGFLQTIIARTKNSSTVALYIRKVEKSYCKTFDNAEEVVADNMTVAAAHEEEVTTTLNSSDEPADNARSVDAIESKRVSDIVKRNQVKTEDDDVCSDDDEVFEHDSSLYDYLRDDSLYTLTPKQHGRLSRIDIRNRTDCDWAKLACKTCNTVYSCTKTLINHMSYQHSDKKAFYPCIFCRNIYSQHKNVARHIMKTHNKTKDFVDKLRGFLRSQAFTRNFINPDIDVEKVITEDSDPFMIKVREKRGQQPSTRYSHMSDKEILAKYGRKVKVIGRPPGRPTKLSQHAIFFTCTICNQEMASLKHMLHHLRIEHKFLQRQINKMRSKLLGRVQEFQAAEKVRQQKEREEQAKKIKVEPVKPGYMVDRYGRWLQSNKVKISPAATSVVKLLKCSLCNAIFASQNALDSHACVAQKSAEVTIVSKTQEPLSGQTLYLMSPAKTSVTVPQENVIMKQTLAGVQQQAINQPQIHETVEISGLETLAEISTNEANKTVGAHMEVETTPQTVIQLTSPSVQTIQQQQPRVQPTAHNQVVTLTLEQLEQLKKSGSNVIYLVNR